MKIPKDFLLGFSESGFQFEMGMKGSEDPNSDWWSWVRDEENIISRIVSGDLPEAGPAYWDLYKKDHEIADKLSMNAARLGIEWSRVFPKETFDVKVDIEENEKGDILRVDVSEKALEELDKIANKQAVEHYKEIFEDWKSRGKKLIINLNHFTLPIWIHEPLNFRKTSKGKAGWVDKRTVVEFVKFTAYVAWKFEEIPDMWSTMNEPNIVYTSGYLDVKSGFPPGYLSLDLAMIATKNLAEAHARAYEAIKAVSKKPVGITYVFNIAEPLKSEEPYLSAAETSNAVLLDFLDLITKGNSFMIGEREDMKGHLDWLGLNYYSRIVVRPAEGRIGFKLVENYGFFCRPNGLSLDGRRCSDLGWEIYPEGLYKALKEAWNKYKLPIIITENGIADSEDSLRPRFLVSHLFQATKAMKEGIDVRGYLHWALTDNYEWAQGFKPRFGLVYVDYQTKKRYLRPSALVFRDIASWREIDEELLI